MTDELIGKLDMNKKDTFPQTYDLYKTDTPNIMDSLVFEKIITIHNEEELKKYMKTKMGFLLRFTDKYYQNMTTENVRFREMLENNNQQPWWKFW